MVHLSESQIPSIEGAIERRRLLQQMQTSNKYQVYMINAPPGYGKTTLAAQFVRRHAAQIVWHTLDITQGDVMNLHERALAAFRSIVPAIQNTTYLNRPAPEELAGALTNLLRRYLPQPTYYVLDDVHHVIGSPHAETWLRTLVSRLPPVCRILLLSRSLPKLPLTEVISRQQLFALGIDDLRFTTEEIDALCQSVGGVTSNDRLHLLEQLEGWPAGISLALHPLPDGVDLLSAPADAAPAALFKSLAMLALESQPSDIRSFLLDSSTLRKITPALCINALGLTQASRHLSEVLRRNLFLSKQAGGLTFHGLFRDFLQGQLHERDPARFVSLHEQAAAWFEQDNQDEQAFDHYLAADLPQKAARIADNRAKLFSAQGKFHTLLQWDHKLSLHDMPAPHLWTQCAVVFTDQYQYDRAEDKLLQAEAHFNTIQNPSGLVNVELLRAYSLLYQGQYQAAIDIAEPLQSALQQFPGERATMLFINGLAHLNLGQTTRAVDYLEAALPLYRQHNDAYAVTALLQSLDVAYVRSRRLADAARCIQEVVRIRRQLGGQNALPFALNNLGYHHHLRGDYVQAKATFDEALDILTHEYDRRGEAYLMWSMGDLVRDRGGFKEAYHFYRRALDIVGGSEPQLECGVLASLATLYRWQRQFPESLAYAQNALNIAREHSIQPEILRASAAVLAARAAAGDAPNALQEMANLVVQFQHTQAYVQHVWVLALCVNIALLNQDPEAASQFLQSILRLVQDDGCVQPLAAETVHNVVLRSFIARYETRYPLIRDAIQKLEEAQVPPEPETAGDALLTAVYSLRIHTLGHSQIERDGELIGSSAWQTAKARELFFLLLLKGPRTKEGLGAELWPESTQGQMHANFHITLSRARQAVGKEVILFNDGLYLINSDVEVWCDAFAFENLVRQAHICSPNSLQAEEMWRKAATLYQGDFLVSLDVDWINSWRTVLREQFIDVLNQLGNCAFARADYDYALTVFQEAAQADPYREDVHQAILKCFAKLERRDKIKSYYLAFQQLLQRELAVSPSPETSQLATDLIG